MAAPPFVFAITSSGTIRVFDLSDPSQPAFVRTLDPPRNDLLVRGAALHDDVLFVLAIGRGGSPTGGLLVIDVSDPNNPQAGELIEIPNGAKSFAIAGDRLYIGVDALLTFDISTPIAPVEIGISPALDILEVAVDPVREQLFSVGVMTAQNFDISDPIAPVLLSQSNSGRGFGIAVAPPLLFISNLNSNFLSNVIRDVSDPSAPFLLSTLFERLNVFVEPSGSPQFVGDQLRVYQSGIRIFDVSSPRSPWPIGQVPTGGLNVVSLGRIVFAARPAVRRIDLGPEYEETKPVDIELRPRLDVNPVNPTSAGSLKVTLYGREDFNVADVRDMTLMLGPARGLVSQLSRRDSNRDGFDDIFLRVPIAETGISFGDARVCLRGRTLDGRPFRGCDAIRTPAIACGLGFEVVPFVVGLAALRRRRSRRV